VAYDDVVLADSPIQYLKLDETSGGTATDTQGLVNGTYTNATLNQAAIFHAASRSVSLSGSTSSVDIANNVAQQRSTSFALEAWVKPTTVGAATMDVWEQAAYGIYIDVTSKAGVFVQIGGTFFFTLGATSLVSGGAYQIGGTWDGTTATVVLNGASDGSATHAGTLTTQTTGLGVGRYPGSPSNYAGLVSHCALYPSLAVARFLAHYRAGQGQSAPPFRRALPLLRR
jgi:hypothetical protein